MPAIRKIVRGAKARDYRVSAFVHGIVESPAFQMPSGRGPESTEVQ
jgi:hypothetical protein